MGNKLVLALVIVHSLSSVTLATITPDVVLGASGGGGDDDTTLSLDLDSFSNSNSSNSSSMDWPSDLPLYFNWCDLGYCTPIKTQCGGSCVNTAKTEVLESRLHILHYPKEIKNFIKAGFKMRHYRAPPKPPILGLQMFEQCKFDRKYAIDENGKKLPSSKKVTSDELHQYGKDAKIIDWYSNWGAYEERVFPRDGACGMCDGTANCTDVECGLKNLPSDCKKSTQAQAIKLKDPCLCVRGLNGRDELYKSCKKNIVGRQYSPCSCERMMSKRGTKPKWSSEYLKKVGFEKMNGWEPTRSKNSKIQDTHDSSYARNLIFANVNGVEDRNRITGPTTVHVQGRYLRSDRENPYPHCSKGANHEVNIVGWNRTEPAVWIVRNSWSDEWGDSEGFGYVKMDCDSCPGKGFCSGI